MYYMWMHMSMDKSVHMRMYVIPQLVQHSSFFCKLGFPMAATSSILFDVDEEPYWADEKDDTKEDRPYWFIAECPEKQECCKGDGSICSHWRKQRQCMSYIDAARPIHYLAKHYLSCGLHNYWTEETAFEAAVEAQVESGVETFQDRVAYRRQNGGQTEHNAGRDTERRPRPPRHSPPRLRSPSRAQARSRSRGGRSSGRRATRESEHVSRTELQDIVRDTAIRAAAQAVAAAPPAPAAAPTRAEVAEMVNQAVAVAPSVPTAGPARTGGAGTFSTVALTTASSRVFLTTGQINFLRDTVNRAASACEQAANACECLRNQFDNEKRILRKADDVLAGLGHQ